MSAPARTLQRGLSLSVLFSVCSIAGIVLFTARRDLAHAWEGMGLSTLAAGGACILLAWLAKAGRMYVLTRAIGEKVRFLRFFQIYMTTSFIAHITPFSAGAVPAQIYLVHREGMTLGAASAMTVLDLGINLVIFLAVIPAAMVLGNGGLAFRIPAWFLPLLLAMAAMIAAGLLWRALRRKKPESGNGGIWQSWRREYALFRGSVGRLRHGGAAAVLAAAALTFLHWFAYLMLAPLIMAGMGAAIPWGYILGAQLVFNFLQVLVPTPGGSGGSELLLLGVFAPILNPEQAGMLVIVWKFFTFYSTMVIGGYFFWRLLGAEGWRRGGIEG